MTFQMSLRLFIFFYFYFFYYILFFFPTVQHGDQVTHNVYIIFAPIVVLHCKYLDMGVSSGGLLILLITLQKVKAFCAIN